MGAIRDNSRPVPDLVNEVVGDIGRITNWEASLTGCDVVLHLPGRAHVPAESFNDPLREFREVNTLGSLNLAKQAIVAGVSRFVFVSSIGVDGAVTSDVPFLLIQKSSPIHQMR